MNSTINKISKTSWRPETKGRSLWQWHAILPSFSLIRFGLRLHFLLGQASAQLCWILKIQITTQNLSLAKRQRRVPGLNKDQKVNQMISRNPRNNWQARQSVLLSPKGHQSLWVFAECFDSTLNSSPPAASRPGVFQSRLDSWIHADLFCFCFRIHMCFWKSNFSLIHEVD